MKKINLLLLSFLYLSFGQTQSFTVDSCTVLFEQKLMNISTKLMNAYKKGELELFTLRSEQLPAFNEEQHRDRVGDSFELLPSFAASYRYINSSSRNSIEFKLTKVAFSFRQRIGGLILDFPYGFIHWNELSNHLQNWETNLLFSNLTCSQIFDTTESKVKFSRIALSKRQGLIPPMSNKELVGFVADHLKYIIFRKIKDSAIDVKRIGGSDITGVDWMNENVIVEKVDTSMGWIYPRRDTIKKEGFVGFKFIYAPDQIDSIAFDTSSNGAKIFIIQRNSENGGYNKYYIKESDLEPFVDPLIWNIYKYGMVDRVLVSGKLYKRDKWGEFTK